MSNRFIKSSTANLSSAVDGLKFDLQHFADLNLAKDVYGAYLIGSTADLDNLSAYVNGGGDTSDLTFKLTADLAYSYASDTDNNFIAIGGTKNSFKGTFDGGGHTISGIRIFKDDNTDADKCQGLFGHTTWAVIRNLTLADTQITAHEVAGGIIGYNIGTVENCHADSTVTINAVKRLAAAHGGIVGYNSTPKAIVRNCTSSATVTTDTTLCSHFGALVGQNSGGTVQNCLAVNAKILNPAQKPGEEIKNVININCTFNQAELPDNFCRLTLPKGATIQGDGVIIYDGKICAFKNAPVTLKLPASAKSFCRVTDGTNSTMAINGICTFTPTADATIEFNELPPVDGLTFNATDGCCEISSVAAMNEFANLVKSGLSCENLTFKLTADIADVTVSIGTSENPFTGTFDGGGHTLTLAINDTTRPATALFRFVVGATIKNLKLEGSVVGAIHAAALIGTTSSGNNIIENVTANVSVTNPATRGSRHIGGIIGHGINASITLKNVVFSGTMSNTGSYAGGLIGWCSAATLNIENCLFSGTYNGNGKFHPVAISNRVPFMKVTVNNCRYTVAPNFSDGNVVTNEGIKI